MASIRVQVRLEGLLGALRKEVVLADELLELRLNRLDLVRGELELDDGNTRSLEVREEAHLVGLEEEETATLVVGATSRSTDTVNVVGSVVRGIELDDEVDSRDLNQ